MSEARSYTCETCGSTKEVGKAMDETPECCGKPMKKTEPLAHCQASDTAEHARLDGEGEPCDDGRGKSG